MQFPVFHFASPSKVTTWEFTPEPTDLMQQSLHFHLLVPYNFHIELFHSQTSPNWVKVHSSEHIKGKGFGFGVNYFLRNHWYEGDLGMEIGLNSNRENERY